MAVMPVLRQPCLLALITTNGKERSLLLHLKDHLLVLPNYRVAKFSGASMVVV